jgi:hypothetical protein
MPNYPVCGRCGSINDAAVDTRLARVTVGLAGLFGGLVLTDAARESSTGAQVAGISSLGGIVFGVVLAAAMAWIFLWDRWATRIGLAAALSGAGAVAFMVASRHNSYFAWLLALAWCGAIGWTTLLPGQFGSAGLGFLAGSVSGLVGAVILAHRNGGGGATNTLLIGLLVGVAVGVVLAAPPQRRQRQTLLPAPQTAAHGGHPAAVGQRSSGPVSARTSGFAIASLVLGLFGMALPAIIFGHVSLRRMNRSDGHERGRGMAAAGLVLGYLWLALALGFGLLLFGAVRRPS